MDNHMPDKKGHFGIFGGRYVAETLMPALIALEKAYLKVRRDRSFKKELAGYLRDYAGRETPLYFAAKLSGKLGGARIYLKREDLNHTGFPQDQQYSWAGLACPDHGKETGDC